MHVGNVASWALSLSIGSAVAAFLAAYFWFRASGKLPPVVSYYGHVPADDRHTVAVQRSAAFNERAALFAGLAALLQASATVLQQL